MSFSEYGHDSKEDALACMKLVWKKIKEDSKIHRPRVSIFILDLSVYVPIILCYY